MSENQLKPEQTVCFNIKVSWHAISKMYNILGTDHGLSAAIGFFLLNIDPKSGSPATQIGPKMGLEGGSLSRIIKNLEEAGWIYRKTDEKDKRIVYICLTKEGLKKRDLARKVVRAFNFTVRDRVGEKNLATFFDVMSTINQVAKHSKEQLLEDFSGYATV